MKKITIRDIAELADVSPSAVSLVLNNKKGVGEKKRRQILDIIHRTNFHPNLNSKRLYFQKSYNISVVTKEISSPFSDIFYFDVTKGVLEKCKEFGYNMLLTDIPNGSINLPECIYSSDADGIIFFQDMEKELLGEAQQLGIPFVIVDDHTNDDSFSYINADCKLSSYVATKHLIDNGHRKIAFIGSSYLPNFFTQSFSGFKQAMDEIGATIPPAWIQKNAVDEMSAFLCMERILDSGNIPTSVYCAGDIYAIGAMNCVKKRGFTVPDQMSFVGIDDILLSRYVEPALTTVRIDPIEMGRLSMDLLIRKINGEKVTGIMVESDNLIKRNSVKSLNI